MISYPKEKITLFCKIFQVPEYVIPWLHRFFEIEEIELILELAGSENRPPLDQDIQERYYRRGIISFDDDGKMIPADFYCRFEKWALFEGWQDVPDEIKGKLNQWQMDYYAGEHLPAVEALQSSGTRDRSHVWPEYALVDEALAIIDRVPHIYQWPCNCRAMMKGCQKPEFVCLRFDNDRNLGWEISKERAKEILLSAHKKGLIQNAELGILPDGTIDGAICNCCSDCCYPQQLSEKFELQAIWPLKRYVVDYNKDLCTACGRCSKRCPFQAFTLHKTASDQKQKTVKTIEYDSTLCRGCGLCESTCPEKAIEMKPLAVSPLSIMKEIIRSN